MYNVHECSCILYMYECISKLNKYNPKFENIYEQNIDCVLHNCYSAIENVKMLNALSITPFLDTSLKMTYLK